MEKKSRHGVWLLNTLFTKKGSSLSLSTRTSFHHGYRKQMPKSSPSPPYPNQDKISCTQSQITSCLPKEWTQYRQIQPLISNSAEPLSATATVNPGESACLETSHRMHREAYSTNTLPIWLIYFPGPKVSKDMIRLSTHTPEH